MMTVVLAAFALAGLWLLLRAPFIWCCCFDPDEPPTCETTINVTVLGCEVIDTPVDNVIEGATVNLKVATITVDTDATDVDGLAQVATTQVVGTAAVLEIIGPSGWGYATQTRNVTLNCTTQNITITLVPDSDHVCVPCCESPVPKTLPVVTTLGSGNAIWGGSFWEVQVTGTRDVWSCEGTSTSPCDCSFGPGSTLLAYTIASGTTYCLVRLRCDGTTWKLSAADGRAARYTGCFTDDVAYSPVSCPSGSPIVPEVVMTGTCGPGVFSLSGTIPASSTVTGTCLNPCFGDPPVTSGCSGSFTYTRSLDHAATGTVTVG